MDVKQPIITRPVLVITVVLCAILFIYVIFSQKHGGNLDRITNPNTHITDKQILGNAKMALPFRHQAPAQFGSPTSYTAPIEGGPAFFSPSPTVIPGTETVLGPVKRSGLYSNLPPVMNPSHPVSMNTAPGAPVPHTVAAPPPSFGSSRKATGSPPTATTNVPPSDRPAYTVLVKSPGDRTRKAVVVNH